MDKSVLAVLKCGLFVIFVCLFTPRGLSEPLCNEAEYFQPVLHKCLSCRDVCVPLNRSDCQRRCPGLYYFLS